MLVFLALDEKDFKTLWTFHSLLEESNTEILSLQLFHSPFRVFIILTRETLNPAVEMTFVSHCLLMLRFISLLKE